MNQINTDRVFDKENTTSNPDRSFSTSCGTNSLSSPTPNSYRQNTFASPRSHWPAPMNQGYPMEFHYNDTPLRNEFVAHVASEMNVLRMEMMKEFAQLKSELTTKMDRIKVPFSGERLDSAELKIGELQFKTDDLADTHHRLLEFVDKQSEDGAGKVAAGYFFNPDRVKDTYPICAKFKGAPDRIVDLRKIAEKSKKFSKKGGVEPGRELVRHILRKIYGDQLTNYSVCENSRRKHTFVGQHMVDKMFELILDGYGISFEDTGILASRLRKKLLEAGTHACSNERRRVKAIDGN